MATIRNPIDYDELDKAMKEELDAKRELDILEAHLYIKEEQDKYRKATVKSIESRVMMDDTYKAARERYDNAFRKSQIMKRKFSTLPYNETQVLLPLTISLGEHLSNPQSPNPKPKEK